METNDKINKNLKKGLKAFSKAFSLGKDVVGGKAETAFSKLEKKFNELQAKVKAETQKAEETKAKAECNKGMPTGVYLVTRKKVFLIESTVALQVVHCETVTELDAKYPIAQFDRIILKFS